ncbi:MAG: choice-of-anchor A family protein [Fimbriimonadaceae bacterium]|nr:MAG: choice-of-anchor A family protein [Fimbriimonadaceae bacterium]
MLQFKFAASLCAFALVASAHAVNLGVANDFNAFIFGNAIAQSGDSDGAVAVGGNWTTVNSYVFNAHSTTPNPTIGSAINLGLYLGGNLNGGANNGATQINSGRNAYVAGTVSNPAPLMNGDGTMFAGSAAVQASTFTNQFAYSSLQSSTLSGLAAGSVNISNPNNYSIQITNTGGLNVYNINGSLLSGGKTLDVVGGNGLETIIFNVTGTSVNWGTEYHGNKNRTLWNFYQATTLNVTDRQLQGSVLAVGAAVNQGQNIEGTLIASSLNITNGAELHSFTFEGNAPVPEPATMIGLGIGALALARRKKRN